MRRILVVNILILLVFAGVFYWADEKKKVETAMAEKGLENIPARPAGSESVQEGEDTKSTEETKEEGYVYFEQNYLYLLPGERRSILVEKNCADKKKIRISSWNTREKIIGWK